MAKGNGNTRTITGKTSSRYDSIQIEANPGEKRINKNQKWAESLEKDGYAVNWNDAHTAFSAYVGNSHKEHEKTVIEILSENGISSTLDREGNMFIKDKRGVRMVLPSSDGTVERALRHEIYALQGEPSSMVVADGIAHSFKVFNADKKKSIQAEISITIAPKGSKYTRKDIDDGVTEFLRRKRDGETSSNPRIYLHIDEERRKVYYRNVRE